MTSFLQIEDQSDYKDFKDHYKETFNQVNSILSGLNQRKPSLGTFSNQSNNSQTRRTTD